MSTATNLVKLLLKVFDDKSNASKWVHLCYLPEDLYNEYKEDRPEDFGNMNRTLARWAKEDFNRDMNIMSLLELDMLKSAVKTYYKEFYPEVYLEQSTDRQGWLRVWISKKMKEDLDSNGE